MACPAASDMPVIAAILAKAASSPAISFFACRITVKNRASSGPCRAAKAVVNT